jgi:hypothetical protein
MIRKVYNEFTSANIIGVTVEHNGYHNGDAGHGGYVKITIKDLASTAMECNVVENMGFLDVYQHDDVAAIELIFRGSTERATLLAALKMAVKELEEHPYLSDEKGEEFIDLAKIKYEKGGEDTEVENNY